MGFVLRIWRYAVVVAASQVSPDPDARFVYVRVQGLPRR
jgi:type IV secretory pathway TrbD component